MKRVNIQSDVQSREQIASSVTQTTVSVPQTVETINNEEDGKSEKVQGCTDDLTPEAEPYTTPKRGRKAKGDVEKIPV